MFFFMFPDARFQSKTNEKLICCLEHLSIDVVNAEIRFVLLELKEHVNSTHQKHKIHCQNSREIELNFGRILYIV